MGGVESVMAEGSTHRAVVINNGRAYRGDGAVVPVPVRSTLDLVWWLDHLTAGFADQCVVVSDDHHPEDVVHAAAEACGWRPVTVGPWSTFTRDHRSVAVGLRKAMHPVHHFGVMLDADTDPGVVAMRLDRYQRATGTAWRGTPALTAHNAIRLSWENAHRTPMWHETRPTGLRSVGHVTWSRNLTETERSWGYVHTFDANAAYLGSAISVDLPWSALGHTGARPFDPGMAGVWRIQPSPRHHELQADVMRPPLWGNRHPARSGLERDGTLLCTTPYARLLHDLNGGEDLAVVDSRLAPPDRSHQSGARILRPWGERIRDALTLTKATTPALAGAVQRTYKDAVGGFQRDKMPITRHVWGWTIIDNWRAQVYRTTMRVHQTQGVWPVRIATDSLSYADSAPTPTPSADRRFTPLTDALGVVLCSLGCGCAPATAPTRLGRWKHETTHETADWPETENQ